MTLIDRTLDDAPTRTDQDLVIDLQSDTVELPRSETGSPTPPTRAPRRAGLRLRRVRLASVAKVAFVLFTVAYASTVASMVVLWNVAQRIGLVDEVEGLLGTALGMEDFVASGSWLFGLVALGAGILCLLGFVLSVLVAVVYNVSGSLFGGLTFDVGLHHQPRAERAATS